MVSYYCENSKCLVMIFEGDPDDTEDEPHLNCPGCGQFGRVKGK